LSQQKHLKKNTFHKIRQVNTQNPRWYRELCAQYSTDRMNNGIKGKSKPRQRKEKYGDTIIKRKRVLETLKLIVERGYSHSFYYPDLEEIARKCSELENLVRQGNTEATNEFEDLFS